LGVSARAVARGGTHEGEYTLRKSTRNHRCVFNSSFVREQIDPRVKAAWEQRFEVKAPFSRLRLSWREEHCQTLNPYGSETCAYREEQCAMSFLAAVEATTANARDVSGAVGYFRRVARSDATRRADEKPMRRETHAEVPAQTQEAFRPSDPSHVRLSDEERQELSRSKARPVAIGDLLGSLYLGPRPGRADDGETSAIERGAPRRPMRAAPPSGVGDIPQAPPETVSPGGER
jgi:hypothetical protein